MEIVKYQTAMKKAHLITKVMRRMQVEFLKQVQINNSLINMQIHLKAAKR